MTEPEANKRLVRRFIDEVVNDGNYDVAADLFTEDYVRHDEPAAREGERGPKLVTDTIESIRTGFPDAEIELGELVAEGDFVAFEAVQRGTHEGPFMGVDPTGTHVEFRGNAIHRIEDGKIAETWATWDRLGVLRQLGVDAVPA